MSSPAEPAESRRPLKHTISRQPHARLRRVEKIQTETLPIRLVKLTKKNALFADSDDSAKTWARCASLTDTLSRIVDMHSMSFLNDLMPWNFTPAIPTVTRQEG